LFLIFFRPFCSLFSAFLGEGRARIVQSL
jgi:hypothetical protein